MDVSVIIVNFNSHTLTSQCIHSLQKYTDGVQYEIIVVDNASEKPGLADLRRQFPGINIIALPENIGFGRANNAGIRIARGKYIFLLNPDTTLLDNAIAAFLAYMHKPENKQVAVCGANLLNETGQPSMSYGRFPSLLGNFLSIGLHVFVRKYYAQNLDTGTASVGTAIREVDYVSGAAFFVRKEVLEQVGCFDEDFFLYFEETELCWRIKKKEYGIVHLPEVKIVHMEGGVTDALQATSFNQFSFYHFYRGKRLFYQKTRSLFPATILYLFDILHEVNKRVMRGRFSEIRPVINLMWKRNSTTSLLPRR